MKKFNFHRPGKALASEAACETKTVHAARHTKDDIYYPRMKSLPMVPKPKGERWIWMGFFTQSLKSV